MKFLKMIAAGAALTALAAPALAQELRPEVEADAWKLALSDAIAAAIEKNLEIAVTRVEPKLAEQSVISSEANFDPQVDASLSYNKNKEEPSSFFSATSRENRSLSGQYSDPLQTGGRWSVKLDYNENLATYPPQATNFGLIPDQYSATLTASFTQPLLRNFGISINRTAIEEAANNLSISQQSVIQKMIAIVEQTENAYWTLTGARYSRAVAKASRSLAQDFLKQTKIRVDVGTLPPIEITNAEAQVASREEAVIVAENRVRDSEDSLRALMHIEVGAPEWSKPIDTEANPPLGDSHVDVEAAIGQAMTHRPELKSADLRVRNLELVERYRDNQVKPQLNATASYALIGNNFEFKTVTLPGLDGIPGTPDDVTTIEREDLSRSAPFSEIPKADNTDWTVGLVFSMPIGNRSAKAELARTRLQIDQEKLNHQALEQQIRVEVRQAARGLESGAQRVASSQANVVLQRKKLEAEQKRFENGLSTSFQVLQAQNDLQDAENALIAASVDWNKARTRLGAAQGTLLAERNVKVSD